MSKMLLALALAGAATIPDASWLIGYAGKPTDAAVGDRRFTPVLRNRVPVTLVGRVLQNLGGPPNPVSVVDGRFVSMWGCLARDCRSKAMLWIDGKGTAALGAAYEPSTDRDRDRLTIGSNGLSANELPAAAMASIVAWLAANRLDPDVVEFIGPSNVARRVDPEPFRSHAR
jgi:hypothetical protein